MGELVADVDVDSLLVRVAELWQANDDTAVDMVRRGWEIGDLLIAVKSAPDAPKGWMKKLPFGERAAQLHMQFRRENPKPASDFPVEEAKALLRKLWGKRDSELLQESKSNEHYTPERYLDAARKVLGGIDVDPASCELANAFVQAKTFYTIEDDGLTKPWDGTVWLNPPYGDKVGDFVGKLKNEIGAKRTTAAIVLVNAHCTDTLWFQKLWDGVLCFTDHRINFYGDDKRSGSTHGSVFIYFGKEKKKFVEEFEAFGAVVECIS